MFLLLLVSFVYGFNFPVEKSSFLFCSYLTPESDLVAKFDTEQTDKLKSNLVKLNKEESKEKDQIETDDDFLDDYIGQNQLPSKFPSLLFLHFSPNCRRLLTVPLYILFHSWKYFLS